MRWHIYALDRYKCPNRYPEIDPIENRDAASSFIHELEQRLDGNLFGPNPKLFVLRYCRSLNYLWIWISFLATMGKN